MITNNLNCTSEVYSNYIEDEEIKKIQLKLKQKLKRFNLIDDILIIEKEKEIKKIRSQLKNKIYECLLDKFKNFNHLDLEQCQNICDIFNYFIKYNFIIKCNDRLYKSIKNLLDFLKNIDYPNDDYKHLSNFYKRKIFNHL